MLKEELIKKVDPVLLEHPAFSHAFDSACHNIIYSTDQKQHNIFVSNDGKSVTISGNGTDTHGVRIGSPSFAYEIISLGEDGSLKTEFGSGIVYNTKELVKKGELEFHDSLTFGSAMDTYHDFNVYDENGIHLSSGFLGSNKNLLTNSVENISIRDQIMDYNCHRPYVNANGMIDIQNRMFCRNGYGAVTTRNKDNLGYLVHKKFKINGFNHVIERNVILAPHTEYPELIQGVGTLAEWSNEKGDYVPVKEGQTMEEIYVQTKEWFKNGIETSKTKNNNPAMYEKLVEIVNSDIMSK